MTKSPIDYEVDRTDWPRGPWSYEPDRLEWLSEGLPCVAVRTQHGSWCGYVGVPLGHPWYLSAYDTIDGVEVHGGLTYSERDQGVVAHSKYPGYWWVGFDCLHCYDWAPGIHYALQKAIGDGALATLPNGTTRNYRPLSFVQDQVERLAEQARKARANHEG